MGRQHQEMGRREALPCLRADLGKILFFFFWLCRLGGSGWGGEQKKSKDTGMTGGQYWNSCQFGKDFRLSISVEFNLVGGNVMLISFTLDVMKQFILLIQKSNSNFIND